MKITYEWDLSDPIQRIEYNSIEDLTEEIEQKKRKLIKIHTIAVNILYELENSSQCHQNNCLKKVIEEIKGYATF